MFLSIVLFVAVAIICLILYKNKNKQTDSDIASGLPVTDTPVSDESVIVHPTPTPVKIDETSGDAAFIKIPDEVISVTQIDDRGGDAAFTPKTVIEDIPLVQKKKPRKKKQPKPVSIASVPSTSKQSKKSK